LSREDVLSVEVQREADGVTVFTVTPEARPEDLVEAFSAFMSEEPTRLVLWDLRQGPKKVSGDELRSMVRELVTLSSSERAAGRSAFVVSHAGDRGVLRTLITYAELGGYGVSLRVFREMSVARSWLFEPTAFVDIRRDADGVTVFTSNPGAGPPHMVQAYATFIHQSPTPLVLWDLRQNRLGGFTTEELGWLARQLSAVGRSARATGRSAFVVARSEERGVAQILIREAELEGLFVQRRVFRNVDVARDWLLGIGPAS
jgi:hypothetical protein